MFLAVASAFFIAGAAGAANPPNGETTVVASKKGFRPATLSARKGETMHLRLTSADGEHCFAIDELRVEKRIVPGRTTMADVHAARVGTFAVYCCLETGKAREQERGTLVVAE